jgi:hypothetical protein
VVKIDWYCLHALYRYDCSFAEPENVGWTRFLLTILAENYVFQVMMNEVSVQTTVVIF